MDLAPDPLGLALRGSDLATWEEDGFVPAPAVVGAADLAELRAECDRLVALVVADFVTAPARAVFDDGVSLFEDKLNLKLPSGAGFPWHQDWPCCWRAHTDELVTCFLYLDDSTEENGCLQVIPRSHAGKRISPFREGSEFAVTITDQERSRITKLPLRAGDMIAFDPYLLHYSAPNRTDRPRRAIIYTYNPARLGDLKRGRFPEAEAGAAARSAVGRRDGRTRPAAEDDGISRSAGAGRPRA